MYSTSQTAGTPDRLTGQILEDGTPMTESMNRFSWGTVPHILKGHALQAMSAPADQPSGLQEQGKLGVAALAFNPSARGTEEKAEARRITVR